MRWIDTANRIGPLQLNDPVLIVVGVFGATQTFLSLAIEPELNLDAALGIVCQLPTLIFLSLVGCAEPAFNPVAPAVVGKVKADWSRSFRRVVDRCFRNPALLIVFIGEESGEGLIAPLLARDCAAFNLLWIAMRVVRVAIAPRHLLIRTAVLYSCRLFALRADAAAIGACALVPGRIRRAAANEAEKTDHDERVQTGADFHLFLRELGLS